MEFSCSECRYISYTKAHAQRHIKNNCELAYVVEVPVDIRCEFCYKEYSTKPNLKRHYKTCKRMIKNPLEDEIKKLKKQLEEANISRTNNITNNITNNLIINVYGKPEIDYLSDQDFANLFMEGSRANANLAKRIWMDPKHPENHSILINNVSRNTAKAYTRPYNSERENPIEVLDQPKIFNKMYDTCKMHFEIKSNDWEEEYHTWPESDQKKYTKLKPKIDKYHAHNEDPESNRKFNKDVKNLLIDNRDMIKKTLANIK
jgi:hypothetical protein